MTLKSTVRSITSLLAYITLSAVSRNSSMSFLTTPLPLISGFDSTATFTWSSDTIKVAAGNYNVGPEHPEIVATMQQVKDAVNNSSITLIDTRALRFHIGIDKKDYVYSYGHIPGSRNLPYKFLNPAKGIAVFFSAEKLRDIIDNLRIDMGTSLILYCNSAYECSSDWFVLHEILGHKDVRIYDGSLHQWTQYDANPMTKKITK